MASKDSANLIGGNIGLMPFLHFGDGAIALQKEMLEAYEQLNRAWLDRVQSEVALWSDLATKLSAAGSVPEALEAYMNCLSQQMQMTAEDGQRLVDGYQKITQRVTKSIAMPDAIRKQGKSSSIRHQ